MPDVTDQNNSTESNPSDTVPKAARGEALETDEGTEVPAQQTTGRETVAGGGEWPDPSAPPQAPAPGAAAEAPGPPGSGPPTGPSGSPPDGSSPAASYDPQRVPLNMYETDGALVIVAPLPGVMADDVEVTVDGRQVTIRAGMRTSAHNRNYRLHEWHYGPFERTVEVPEGFGGDAAASFGNGQLALRLGRGEPASGKVVVSPGD